MKARLPGSLVECIPTCAARYEMDGKFTVDEEEAAAESRGGPGL